MIILLLLHSQMNTSRNGMAGHVNNQRWLNQYICYAAALVTKPLLAELVVPTVAAAAAIASTYPTYPRGWSGWVGPCGLVQ